MGSVHGSLEPSSAAKVSMETFAGRCAAGVADSWLSRRCQSNDKKATATSVVDVVSEIFHEVHSAISTKLRNTSDKQRSSSSRNI